MIKKICSIAIIAISLGASHASAKVSAVESEKLGRELTPVGAERAGNASGSIPEWTGGIIKAPAGYVEGKPYVDPFANDKIKFTINKSNMAEYSDNLSSGQKAMLSKYDSYKLNVYPTRRSVGVSNETIKRVKENSLNAEMVDSGNGLINVNGVIPFPITQNPIEVLWNHILRERGDGFSRVSVQVTPTENGDFTPIVFDEEFSPRHELSDFSKNKDDNVFFYFKQRIASPARLAGSVLLVHETINQIKEPRRSWIYNSGQRRVRRAPQVAYDSPGTASDGLKTTDNFDGFNGAPDRYNWTLEGKKELYIPYNSYALDNKDLSYKDIVKKGHINANYTRYELHRVWKITGTLKSGERHLYSKRTLYIDEDTWGIAVADHYDSRGELWRHYEAHSKYHYDVKTALPTVESVHDLLSGRYIASGLANEERVRFDFKKEFKTIDFTPAALRRSSR